MQGSSDMNTLPVRKASEIVKSSSVKWLVQSLWTQQAVGLIVGQPKSGKSWLALDFAVSVASGTAVLGKFCVQNHGPVLIFPAEDNITAVRDRLAGICKYRGVDLEKLYIWMIGSFTLHLDTAKDREALENTLCKIRPSLLILDPLIRIHNLDENSATEIAKVLSFLRTLQRKYSVAVLLVHHAKKSPSADPGLGLRGSSEIRAWADSILYLQRKKNLELVVEHRAAPSPESFKLSLATNDASTVHLSIEGSSVETVKPDLKEQILKVIQKHGLSLSREYIRRKVGVQYQKVCDALKELEKDHLIEKTEKGYALKNCKCPF